MTKDSHTTMSDEEVRLAADRMGLVRRVRCRILTGLSEEDLMQGYSAAQPSSAARPEPPREPPPPSPCAPSGESA